MGIMNDTGLSSNAKTYNQRYYAIRKAEVEEEAIKWQADFCNHNYSYEELAYWEDHFTRLGKRYGLLREFKENAIC